MNLGRVTCSLEMERLRDLESCHICCESMYTEKELDMKLRRATGSLEVECKIAMLLSDIGI